MNNAEGIKSKRPEVTRLKLPEPYTGEGHPITSRITHRISTLLQLIKLIAIYSENAATITLHETRHYLPVYHQHGKLISNSLLIRKLIACFSFNNKGLAAQY